MKIVDWDTVVLSSGREFYAHAGILGLGALHNGLTGGWDNSVDESPTEFTIEERREIAQYMAERWLAWGETGISIREKSE